jgi:hypothetical protein
LSPFWKIYNNFFKTLRSQALVAPSYLGGRDQEDHSLKPAGANSLQDPILKKPFTEKGWWSGSRCKPLVQGPVLQKNKKQKQKQKKLRSFCQANLDGKETPTSGLGGTPQNLAAHLVTLPFSALHVSQHASVPKTLSTVCLLLCLQLPPSQSLKSPSLQEVLSNNSRLFLFRVLFIYLFVCNARDYTQSLKPARPTFYS